MIKSPTVRTVEGRQHNGDIMYRKHHSLESVIALFAEHSRDEIASTIRGGGGYDTGSCTESCEAISCDVDEEENEDTHEQVLSIVSPYCQNLNELRARPAHMLKEVGDQWRTPDALWWGINAKFGPFVLDLFADHHNAKCEAYYTAEDNALTQNWFARLAELGGAAYANPPYSRAQQFEGQYITGMAHIMQHTMAMRELGGRYVYLIKAATSESWWPESADHIAFIRGRIGFDLPDWFVPADEKQKPSGAFFAGAIVVFDKSWNGPASSYISREELETMGEMFIQQIQRAALRIQGVAA